MFINYLVKMKIFLLIYIIMFPYNCLFGHNLDTLKHSSLPLSMLKTRFEEEKNNIRSMLKTIITQKQVPFENAIKFYNSTINSKAPNVLKGTPSFKGDSDYQPSDLKSDQNAQNYYFQDEETLKANKEFVLPTKELATFCKDSYQSDSKFCKDMKESENKNYKYNGSKIRSNKNDDDNLKSITYYSVMSPFLQEQTQSQTELIASRHNKASDKMSDEVSSSKINYSDDNEHVQPGQQTQQIIKEISSSSMSIDPELALVLGLSKFTPANKLLLPTYLNETNVNFIDHGFPTEQPKPFAVEVFEQLFSEDEMQNNQVVQDMHERLENKINTFHTVSNTPQGNSIVFLIVPVAVLALLVGVMSGAVPPLLMGLLGLAIPASIFVTLVNVGDSAARRSLKHDSILEYANLIKMIDVA